VSEIKTLNFIISPRNMTPEKYAIKGI